MEGVPGVSVEVSGRGGGGGRELKVDGLRWNEK